MEELEQILLLHAARYPKMEPMDAVKLIYQNEFGGGHLIRDEAACLAYLHREYEAVSHDPEMIPAEPIGNGIVRIYLAAVREEDLKQVGRWFIRSAALHCGTVERFRKKLTVLRRLTEEGIFSFSPVMLESYLADYEKAGFPPVSHSESYRRAYKPAYRIVLEKTV